MSKPRGRLASSILQENLCPFLYETRTIRHTRGRTRLFSSTTPPCEGDSAGQKVQGLGENSKKLKDKGFNFFRFKSRDVEGRQGRPRGSTLTSEERKIFESIRRAFGADIDALAREVPPVSEHAPERSRVPLSTKSNRPTTDLYDTDINNVLSLFAPAPIADTQPIVPTEHNNQDAEPQNRKPYPPHLIRAAALKALTNIADRIRFASRGTSSVTAIQPDPSTTDLTPDQRLWRLTTTQILPLITLLQNPPLRPESQELERSPRGQRIQQLTIGDIKLRPSLPSLQALGNSPNLPLLPLISILYPAATLLISRTFASHLPTSGYILALLPKIRELGPTSYLLAGNVHFYNTLLQVMWDVYSDVSGMDKFLREMRRDGVGLDEGTLKVLEVVRADKEADLAGGTGRQGVGRGKLWWNMRAHQDGFGKLDGYWRGVINREIEKRRLQERGNDDGDGEDVD